MKSKDELIEVWLDTEKRIKEEEYPSRFECYMGNSKVREYPPRVDVPYNTPIKVLNEDCVEVARKLSLSGRTCILNMASYKRPGGGVKKGSMAQEEELARRSNLVFCLPEKYYHLGKTHYIYTKDVTFFKDRNYEIIPSFQADVITIAAINLNELDRPEDYTNIMTGKIMSMLFDPIIHGCENIVLSAFGCGVFKNDPDEVASLFKSILDSGYSKIYKNITFAILNDKNSVGSNFEIFEKILTKQQS